MTRFLRAALRRGLRALDRGLSPLPRWRCAGAGGTCALPATHMHVNAGQPDVRLCDVHAAEVAARGALYVPPGVR